MKVFHSDAYSLPIIGSVLTHAVLLTALMAGAFNLFSSSKPIPTNVSELPAIQAVAVSEAQLNDELARLEQRDADEAAAQQALLDQAEAARQARIREEQQLVALRAREEAAAREAEQQEQARIEAARAEQTRLAEQQQRVEEEAAREAEQQVQAERARQAALEQQRLAEEAVEQARLETIRTSVVQSEVQRYGNLVRQKVARFWAIQGSVTPGAYTTLNVRLSTNGTVLNVQVVQSSGNDVLDRTAEAAVYKASPLPVPEDPDALEQFRELRLTLRPDEILTQR